jgi:hypothetical protein
VFGSPTVRTVFSVGVLPACDRDTVADRLSLLKVTDPETDSVDAAAFAVTVTVPLPFPEEGEMLKPVPDTLAVQAWPAVTLMVWEPPSSAKERLFGLTDNVASAG